MERRLLSWFCVVSFACKCSAAEEPIGSVIQELRGLNKDVRRLQKDIPRIEKKAARDVKLSEAALKEKFSRKIIPRLVERRFPEVLSDLFRNKSLDDMVNSHVVSEILDMKENQTELQTRQRTLVMEVENITKEGSENTEKLLEHDSKIERLEQLVDQLMQALNETKEKVKSLEGDNSKLQEIVNELQVVGLESNETMKNGSKESGAESTVLEYILETSNRTSKRVDLLEHQQKTLITFKDTLTCDLHYGYRYATTPVSRLLITTFHASLTDSHQLNLNSHQVSSFQPLKINNILSVAYDPTRQQLLFSRRFPDGIYSMKLDGTELTLVLAKFSSFGMAVDQGRQLVIMTTYHPYESVSKMSTGGNDFTQVADLRSKGNYPFGIAIDSRNSVIYMCNYDKLFTVDYEGRNFRELYSGLNILGVAVDFDRNLVYFNNDTQIWSTTLSGNKTELLAEIDVLPLNLKYYNDSLYISDKGAATIYELDVNTTTFTKTASVEARSVLAFIP